MDVYGRYIYSVYIYIFMDVYFLKPQQFTQLDVNLAISQLGESPLPWHGGVGGGVLAHVTRISWGQPCLQGGAP
jgi:hypothetical protein